MALRLTGTTTNQPASDTEAAEPWAETLGPQAQALLQRGDVSGYAALFADATRIDEPHRRYHARVTLVQAGLMQARQLPESAAARVFLTAADAALTALEEEPAEPILLNLAGVTLYELWSLDAAQALFRAARRLDPELPDARRNLQELGRRRQLAGRRTRPLNAAVPGLARRAREVAGHARAATGLTLSLCMIVRDEERMLPRCLAAVAPAVDEIIVVDTGSTDRTIEIARSFGARVTEFEWTGSFADARNASFEAATGDWLLYLDADEVLVAEDLDELRAVCGRTWREALYLVETSYLGELGAGSTIVNNALRIFRNRPEYRFTGRLHEQIAHTLPTFAPGRIEQTAVRIQHYGYLGSVRVAKEKSKRNVELLRQQAAEAPATPFLHFNLGSEYAAADDPPAAVEQFLRAHALMVKDGSLQTAGFAPTLLVRLVTMLCRCGRTADALARIREGLQLYPDFTDLILAEAQIAERQDEPAQARRLYERCIEVGDAPTRYHPMIGCGTFLPRLALAALDLQAGDTAAARSRVEWCIEHHPDFLGVAAPYVSVLVRDGVPGDEAVAELERRLGALPGAARLGVADALRAAGAADAAIDQYRLSLESSPERSQIRAALGELLLERGDWDGAAEQVRTIAADDPFAGIGCRIELMALTGRTGVDAALERAARAQLPKAELDVFSAWAAIADGVPAPDGLSVAGVPVLAVILETLLRGGDTARFNALVPALAASRLPEREQRELLAGMYLSAGLTAAAAQQWMAACREQPDARGLLGLARVAVAQGMLSDAATFAEGALELDPACTAAQELLAALPVAAAGV